MYRPAGAGGWLAIKLPNEGRETLAWGISREATGHNESAQPRPNNFATCSRLQLSTLKNFQNKRDCAGN